MDLEFYQKYYTKLSQIFGIAIDQNNICSINVPEEVHCEVVDEILGRQNNLIRSVHAVLPYSLLKSQGRVSELQKRELPASPEAQGATRATQVLHVPAQVCATSLDVLNKRSTNRAFQIIREDTSDNTHRAHKGDLLFFQAFLSAIGFTFKEPIQEKEVISFIVQLAEGVDHDIDEVLVKQGYKNKLGTQKMATIKRRVGSLSAFLGLAKLPNPCRSKEVITVLNKLTKKYGASRPAGKAITKDILDDMLDTCKKNKLIDIRDRAVLLFAWGSGGRRRSEVASARFSDLTKSSGDCGGGDYIYLMPKSKTDQQGQGFHLPLNGRVAQAITQWLEASKIVDGPLFRSVSSSSIVSPDPLSPVDINRIVKRRLKRAGYDEKQYGAHGLRSGFVTTCGKKAIPLGDVMQMTTHKTVSTVMRYYQAGNIANNKAANLAD